MIALFQPAKRLEFRGELAALLTVRTRYIWRKFRGHGRRSGSSAVLKNILVLSPLALFCVGIFFALLAGLGGASDENAEIALGSLLALTALGSFVGSSTTALQSLYMSHDLPFLMALPLPLRAIYGGKFADAMAGALPAGIVMVLALVAFGYQQGGGLTYLVAATICLVQMLLIATSISVLLVAAVTRFVPPKRAKFFLIGTSLTIVFSVFALWSAMLPDTSGASNGFFRQDPGPVRNFVSASPAGWAANALSAAAHGELVASLMSGGAFTFFALLCTVSAYRVFTAKFAIGYAKVRGLTGARPKRPFAMAAATAASWLPQQIGALVVKEWLVMFRDLRRLSGAIWPLGMVAVYTVALSRAGSSNSDDDLRFWMINGPLALLPWGASLGISIYAIGTEGANFELVRMTPTHGRRLFLAKAFAAFVPVFVIAEVATLIVSTARHTTGMQALALTGIVAWAAIGYVLIDTSASAIEPNFDAEHVQRSTSLGGRMVGFMTGAIFGLASVVAIGRIVLFTTETPYQLEGALSWKVGSIAPLGWPLILAATLIALAVVARVVAAAIHNLNRLIKEGS